MTVTLTWNPVTVTGLTVSYNLYRATVSGGPYTLAATNITGTNYTDGPANLDETAVYYYVLTSFTQDGESPFSLQVTATPPALPGTPSGLVATIS